MAGRMSAVALALVVIVWYGSSAVAGASTRRLLRMSPAPLQLCLCQFAASVALGAVVIHVLKAYPYAPVHPAASRTVWKIATAYSTGFLSLTATMAYVTVSLSETFRAGEPLFTVVLGRAVLGEWPSGLVLASLVPIVSGVACAALGAVGLNPIGLATAFASNTAFSLRSVWTKQLRRQHQELGTDMGGVVLLYHVSMRGLVILCGYQAVALATLPRWASLPTAVGDAAWSDTLSTVAPLLCMNVLCFFTYNQMSFVVLSQVPVLTHAVANGFRRVATIVCAVLYFGTVVKPVNAAGMVTAVAGVLSYAYARSRGSSSSSSSGQQPSGKTPASLTGGVATAAETTAASHGLRFRKSSPIGEECRTTGAQQ